MEKTVPHILLFILLLTLPTAQKILRYGVRERANGDTLSDIEKSYKLLKETDYHPVKGSNLFSKKHDAIYALSLSQDRNKIAYFVDLEVGNSKEKLDFMIDSGKKKLNFFNKKTFLTIFQFSKLNFIPRFRMDVDKIR